MRIKWYGTASLLLESGDTRLLIDPYLHRYNKKAPPFPVDDAKTADAIFITHPHFDHFSDIDVFTKGGIRRVYVSKNGIARAQELGFDTDCMTAIEPNEEYTVGAFKVRTYRSRHCVFDAATVLGVVFSPRTWLRAKTAVTLLGACRKFKLEGDVLAFGITDGEKQVFVLGSAGMEEDVEYPQGADMLVFPYQGRRRMHRYMQPFLGTFAPKAVFADHFDDAFPPLTHRISMEKFGAAAKERLPGIRAIVPEENEWYEV